jgi:ribose-phosphate pyrophosphokinase
LIVVPGPASVKLGRKIANLLKVITLPIEFKRFPDGESYIRFEDAAPIKNEDVVIVQTTGPPQNENLVQLLLMADNARDLGAKSIAAVVPYFAYARQDSRFRSGESLSVKTIAALLKTCGVSRILTVNSHNPTILKTFPIPIADLSAITLLAQHFKMRGFIDALSLSLGKKGMRTAEEANRVLKGGCDYIATQRDRVTGTVAIEKKMLQVKDRDAVIFDDIISSGGTMIKAVEWVKQQGARRVYAACVHPLLIGDTRNRILRAGADGVVGTDTVPSAVSEVSVATLIADALAKRVVPGD